MAERTVRDAAVEAMAGVLGEDTPWRTNKQLAAHALDALLASAEVREGLVAALSPGRYLWRSPDDDQFASFDRDEMAHAILAALGGTEATE